MSPMKPASPREATMDDTLSLDRLARRWQKSRKEVRQLLADRILDFVQIRGHLRVPKEAVLQYERTHLAGHVGERDE